MEKKDHLNFSFADTEDYATTTELKFFLDVLSSYVYSFADVVVVVVMAPCAHLAHSHPMNASTQYFSQYGPFNLSIPLCSKYFSSL